MKGVISNYIPSKGYGFVAGEDGTTYFLHHSAYRGGHLATGMKIRFEASRNAKGPYVTRVN